MNIDPMFLSSEADRFQQEAAEFWEKTFPRLSFPRSIMGFAFMLHKFWPLLEGVSLERARYFTLEHYQDHEVDNDLEAHARYYINYIFGLLETEREERLAKIQTETERAFFEYAWSHGINLTPQVYVGKYRIDFEVLETQWHEGVWSNDCRIGIEIDGHSNHKSKEERTYDARRQRWLELNGWKIIRFTNTEVKEDVGACIRDLSGFISRYGFVSSEER